MRTIARMIWMITLFLFSCFGCVWGQCFNWMLPEYSTYTSITTDGHKIYASVTVDGTTGGSCNPNTCDHCNQILNPPPMHTPKAYNLIGSTGGWGTGNSGVWNSYISYTNNQSIPAQQQLTPVVSTGEVVCSAAGLLYEVSQGDYTAASPNCGGNNGEIVVVYASPQSQKCDGKTTYSAGSSVSGSGATNITEVSVSTATDNTLLIDLLGGPSANSLCGNKAGSSQWCYAQNYKTAVPNSYTGTSGNIDWKYQIFCGTKVNPDIYGTVPQRFTCQ